MLCKQSAINRQQQCHCAVAAPGYLLVWLQYPCRATAWGSTTTPRGHRVKTVNSRGCPVSTVQCWWWDVNQAYDSLVTPGPGPQQGHRWYCSSDVYTEVTISLAPSTMLSLSLSHPQLAHRLYSCSDDTMTLSYPQHYPPAPGTPPGDVYTEVSTICTMSLSLAPTTLCPPSPWCPHRVPIRWPRYSPIWWLRTGGTLLSRGLVTSWLVTRWITGHIRTDRIWI